MTQSRKELVLKTIEAVLEAGLIKEVPLSMRKSGPEVIYTLMTDRSSPVKSLRRGYISQVRGIVATVIWGTGFSSPEVAEMVGYNSHTSVVEAKSRHEKQLRELANGLRIHKEWVAKPLEIQASEVMIPEIKENEKIPQKRKDRPMYDDGNDDSYIPWSKRDLTQPFYRA